MNLNNFEEKIEKKILNRGYDYYLEGNIVDCTFEQPDIYRFDVEGSENYEVIVKVDENNEILMSYCDCPYDYGPVCKHEAAAYYYLREKTNSIKDIKFNSKNKYKYKFEDVIESLSKDELINIIKELTNRNKTLKEKILFKYAHMEDGDELKQCKKLVKSIINKHSQRDGFIDYYHAGDFADEVSCVLDKINDIYTHNVLIGLEIAEYLILELIEVEENCDDSDGFIYGVVDDTLDVIADIADLASSKDIEVQDKVFKKLIKLSKNDKINEFEYHTCDILRHCLYFCDDVNFRNILKVQIEENIEKESKSEYGNYKIEELVKLLFAIIKKYGTEEEIENCINDNIKFTSFREKVIEHYIAKKEYDKALDTAMDGENKDKNNNILSDKWKEYRYNIYKQLNNTTEQEKLGRELLFRGYFKYYADLKDLNKDDFDSFYKEIINSFKSSANMYASMLYLKIILKENDTNRILDYLKKNPYIVEEYVDRIAYDYKDEAEELYKNYIFDHAEKSSNRKMYKSVCASIKRYRKLFDSESTSEIINKLLNTYNRRPAFVDELKKLK